MVWCITHIIDKPIIPVQITCNAGVWHTQCHVLYVQIYMSSTGNYTKRVLRLLDYTQNTYIPVLYIECIYTCSIHRMHIYLFYTQNTYIPVLQQNTYITVLHIEYIYACSTHRIHIYLFYTYNTYIPLLHIEYIYTSSTHRIHIYLFYTQNTYEHHMYYRRGTTGHVKNN